MKHKSLNYWLKLILAVIICLIFLVVILKYVFPTWDLWTGLNIGYDKMAELFELR